MDLVLFRSTIIKRKVESFLKDCLLRQKNGLENRIIEIKSFFIENEVNLFIDIPISNNGLLILKNIVFSSDLMIENTNGRHKTKGKFKSKGELILNYNSNCNAYDIKEYNFEIHHLDR